MITVANRHVLLDVARTAILATVTGKPQTQPQAEGELARRAAAFVSLHVAGALRGCIGHLEEDDPLVHTVAECARLACTEDPRFPAVTPAEVDLLDVEISVLGPLERVEALGEIVVGRHGLLVEHDRRRGLLLPQVATDYRWTAEYSSNRRVSRPACRATAGSEAQRCGDSKRKSSATERGSGTRD